jgi:hypothetical protein
MDNANVLLGIVVVLPVLTLLVAYVIESEVFSSPHKNRVNATVQCHECLGSHDATCASSCGMPS